MLVSWLERVSIHCQVGTSVVICWDYLTAAAPPRASVSLRSGWGSRCLTFKRLVSGRTWHPRIPWPFVSVSPGSAELNWTIKAIDKSPVVTVSVVGTAEIPTPIWRQIYNWWESQYNKILYWPGCAAIREVNTVPSPTLEYHGSQRLITSVPAHLYPWLSLSKTPFNISFWNCPWSVWLATSRVIHYLSISCNFQLMLHAMFRMRTPCACGYMFVVANCAISCH